MKNVFSAILISFILLLACARRESAAQDHVQELKLQYDTTAIDSFSTGAISIDIVRQIKMSSQKYQDSVKEALKIEKEEKRIKAEVELESKKKLDQEKKKASEEKAAEQK